MYNNSVTISEVSTFRSYWIIFKYLIQNCFIQVSTTTPGPANLHQARPPFSCVLSLRRVFRSETDHISHFLPLGYFFPPQTGSPITYKPISQN